MSIISDVQEQGIDSGVVSLYELDLGTSIGYFSQGGLKESLTAVQFRDSTSPYTIRTYQPLPIEVEGFDVSSDGSYSRPTLTVANIENVFSNAAGTDYEALIGKRFTRRTTLRKYLVDGAGDASPPVEFPKTTYIIDRIKGKNAIQVQFELAAPFDLARVRLPRRIIVGGACPWKYTEAGSKIYDTSGSAYIARTETQKEGGCNWRADSKITINGTEYTAYMNENDEYILPSSLTYTTFSSSATKGNYYKTVAALTEIKSDGTKATRNDYNYWQCLSNTSDAPADSNSAWRRIRIHQTHSASQPYYGFTDNRFNHYIVSAGRLWQVKRTTQDGNAHQPRQSGDFWKLGDVCGKKVTSCAMRFQAKITTDGSGAGFAEIRDSRISLPFGGFPGVVQRR